MPLRWEADGHEEAAEFWDEQGDADAAELERRDAQIERDAAEHEADRAEYHRERGTDA
jgi:hypothetical protein